MAALRGSFFLSLSLSILVLFLSPNRIFAKEIKSAGMKMNVVDRCWRQNPNWRRDRQQLATCSVGFAGKMGDNTGEGLVHYEVTDPSDDPVSPKPGTLRYGATMIKEKVWITFRTDMRIRLQKLLLVSSFTVIDGRGASVHIADGACLLLYKVTNVIIHGIRVHHCSPQPAGPVMAPDSKIIQMRPTDGDAIRLIGSSKIWIDHTTLYACKDGLLDVTRGSTDITVSNNWFRSHNKVMLLGHDDGFVRDRNMRVTVIFNYFGPDCYQRMPRVRHGYAHVANNLYKGWENYAIGGSMNPSIMSEGNLFIAPTSGNKQVTLRMDANQIGSSWNFHSQRDIFENGAFLNHPGGGGGTALEPHYNGNQRFPVVDARFVRAITRSAGALRCPKRSAC